MRRKADHIIIIIIINLLEEREPARLLKSPSQLLPRASK
jgi:hypothetical protein